jgi:hypothetical protein
MIYLVFLCFVWRCEFSSKFSFVTEEISRDTVLVPVIFLVSVFPGIR